MNNKSITEVLPRLLDHVGAPSSFTKPKDASESLLNNSVGRGGELTRAGSQIPE